MDGLENVKQDYMNILSAMELPFGRKTKTVQIHVHK